MAAHGGLHVASNIAFDQWNEILERVPLAGYSLW